MYHPRLKGKHYDMGYHYGELLYKMGENLSSVIQIPNNQREYGLKCLSIYEKYLPNIMEEVRGLADGLKQKYEDIACWLFAIYCFESDHGCTVLAVKQNDSVFFARNMDMFPEYKKTSESVLYMPQNKNKFIAHSTAIISVEDGMNEHGLAVALTFLLPKNLKPGINGGFIVRLLLEECKTTNEALELIEELPISSSHNIVIADKTGNMAVVECNCDVKKIRKSKDYIIATNHFIDSDMIQYNNTEENWYKTEDRYNTIDNYLKRNTVDFEKVKELISGKYGFICQYEKQLHFDTIWSSVYQLDNLYNEICEGNPAKTKFKYDNRLEWGMKR